MGILLLAGLILLCRWFTQLVRQTAYNKDCSKTILSTKGRTLALHWLVVFSFLCILLNCFSSQSVQFAFAAVAVIFIGAIVNFLLRNVLILCFTVTPLHLELCVFTLCLLPMHLWSSALYAALETCVCLLAADGCWMVLLCRYSRRHHWTFAELHFAAISAIYVGCLPSDVCNESSS